MKFILVLLLIIGGFTLASHFTPQLLTMQLFHLGQYTVTGAIVLIGALFYAGIKTID